MANVDLQYRLDEYYEELRRGAAIPTDEAELFSAPLLISIPDDWLQSRSRMILFGQETRDWGLGQKWHWRDNLGESGLPERAATTCRQCPFTALGTLKDFYEHEDSVRALKHAYETFDLGRNQGLVRLEGERVIARSQFWRAFHRLMRRVEGCDRPRAALWSNFTISDRESGSVLRGGGILASKFLSAYGSAVVRQVEILQPKAAVFMIGAYQKHLRQLFPGLKLRELRRGFPAIMVADHAPSPLPAKTAWTAHPSSSVWEKSTWEELLPALGDWISQPEPV
jgi:hypothetical protein